VVRRLRENSATAAAPSNSPAINDPIAIPTAGPAGILLFEVVIVELPGPEVSGEKVKVFVPVPEVWDRKVRVLLVPRMVPLIVAVGIKMTLLPPDGFSGPVRVVPRVVPLMVAVGMNITLPPEGFLVVVPGPVTVYVVEAASMIVMVVRA